MCNKYLSSEAAEIERFWHVGARNPAPWQREVFPRATGPFVRRRRGAAGYERELVVGQWGLIPWFAKEPKLTRAARGGRRSGKYQGGCRKRSSKMPTYSIPTIQIRTRRLWVVPPPMFLGGLTSVAGVLWQ